MSERETVTRWWVDKQYCIDDEEASYDLHNPRIVVLASTYDALTAEREADRGRMARLEEELARLQRTVEANEKAYLAEHEHWGPCQWKQRCEALERELGVANALLKVRDDKLGAALYQYCDDNYHKEIERLKQQLAAAQQRVTTAQEAINWWMNAKDNVEEQLQQAQQQAAGLKEALAFLLAECTAHGARYDIARYLEAVDQAKQALAPDQAQRGGGGEVDAPRRSACGHFDCDNEDCFGQ